MQLLRFTTAGSVDDGKSTLIGRLLYDSKSIFEDQLEAVEEASRSRGNEEVNLALLIRTDFVRKGSRASLSMSHTAISLRRNVNSSSPILRATSSIPETWLPVRLLPTSP